MSDTFPFQPTERSLNSAEKNEKISSPFLEAFFKKEDLLHLLNLPSAIGIRIYPCLNREQNIPSMLALAVQTILEDSGNKRGDIDSFYVLSGGDDKNVPSKLIDNLMEKQEIQSDVEALQGSLTEGGQNIPEEEHRTGFFSVFFSQDSILHLIGRENCAGLRFFGHDLLGFFDTKFTPRTFTAVPVDGNDSQMDPIFTTINQSDGTNLTIETSAFESLAPCPPDCGDPQRYINPYKVDLNIGVNPLPNI
jgi:hypothetical protein